VDRSDDLVGAFQASGFDALVSIGGDGSLQISHDLWRKGLPVVCVPKTIDNDVSGTQRTFGFDTAISTATEAIDKLHSTAESHDRVMVVELMGRYAGWIALYSGLSGSADVILLPEIPFDMEKVCEKIRSREAVGRHFSIVVVAEGARPKDGTVEVVERRGVGTVDRLGGIASKVARTIEEIELCGDRGRIPVRREPGHAVDDGLVLNQDGSGLQADACKGRGVLSLLAQKLCSSVSAQ